MGAPGATATGQRGSWATERPPNLARTRAGIAGPVWLGPNPPSNQTSLIGTPTPQSRALGATKPVTRRQGSGPQMTRGLMVHAVAEAENLLQFSIPSGLFRWARKFLSGDEATNATIPGRAPWSQAFNESAPTGTPTSPIPIPVEDWLSELVYRWYVGMGRYRFEDVHNGGKAAQIVADVEIARSTSGRQKMAPPHQTRLTGASLLPTSPTLSRYQQVLGTADLEGSTLY